jgi:5'(3')-deoxyribonucleotidase
MRILIDMDAIVVDMNTRWYETFNRESGDDLTPEKVVDWDTGKFITKSTPRHLYGILTRPGFYDDLDPLPGAIDGVNTLAYGLHEIRFCSASPSPDASRAKMEWVDRHFAHLGWCGHKMVILTHEKHWIDADVLIDDSPSNLRNWIGDRVPSLPGDRRAITIEYPYNRGIAGVEYAGSYVDTEKAWERIVRKLG